MELTDHKARVNCVPQSSEETRHEQCAMGSLVQ